MYKTIAFIALIPFLVIATYAQIVEPATARENLLDGIRLMREGNLEAALLRFEKSVSLDPKEAAAWGNLGSAAFHLKKYENAENAYRTAIRLQPKQAGFHAELCRVLTYQKKVGAALLSCDEAIRLEPTSEVAHAFKIWALQSANRLPELQRFIDLAVAQFRNSELVLVAAVDFYIESQNFVHAATLQEALVAMKPSVARHHGVLAEIYCRLDRDDDSLRSARTALRLEPNNPYANYAMGLIFFEFGQHEEAIESFRKVITDDSRSADAEYYAALSEKRRGRPREAVAALQKLTERYPDDVQFLEQLASTLLQMDRFADAQAAYSKARRLDSQSHELLSGLGMTYMMQGNYQPAIENFEAALRIKPDSDTYRMFLNAARARQSIVANLPATLAEFDPATTNDIKVLFDTARALSFTNRFNDFDRCIERIYKLDPPDHELYHRIGVMLVEMGQKGKAVIAYRKAIEKGQNPGSYFGLAALYRDMGDFEQASAAFARGIELKSDTPTFMKMYADMLQQNGKRREALEMYKRSLSLKPANPPTLFEAAILSAKLGDKTSALAYLGILKSVDAAAAQKLEFCLSFLL